MCDGTRPGRRCESAKGEWCLRNIRGRPRRSHMYTRRRLQSRVVERIVDFAIGIFSIGEIPLYSCLIDIVHSTHQHIADPCGLSDFRRRLGAIHPRFHANDYRDKRDPSTSTYQYSQSLRYSTPPFRQRPPHTTLRSARFMGNLPDTQKT